MNEEERSEIRVRIAMFMEELLDEFSELSLEEIRDELRDYLETF